MYCAGRTLRRTDGRRGPAFAAGGGRPKLERVTARLLELLAGPALDEPDADDQEAPVGPRAS